MQLPSPARRNRRLERLLESVRACRACEAELPLGPRPVVQMHAEARVLIVGQAPSARVHASGTPWDDASGKRLRAWMNVDEAQFYDATRIAILPMGFCYPGRGARGDLPPRAECAPLWLDRLLRELPSRSLTLLIGQYAQRHFLAARRKGSLTATVQNFRAYLPAYLPLPHPSPRNTFWLTHNPWFEREVLPALRERVQQVLRR